MTGRNTAERFSRVILAIGPEKFEKLQKARVVVVGLGAVGGFAAEALVRTGIGAIRLIDIDTIQVSNINRQILALDTTLGRRKVDVAAERFHRINPDLKIEVFHEFMHADTAEKLLENNPDFIVDATDSVNPKVALLVFCRQHGLPVISVMGAAYKTRFDLVRITDISRTEVDPLSRIIRRRLRRRGVQSGIPVVYSPEPGPPFKPLEEMTEREQDTATHQGRPRVILGSTCPFPAIFGMLAAQYVIRKITS